MKNGVNWGLFLQINDPNWTANRTNTRYTNISEILKENWSSNKTEHYLTALQMSKNFIVAGITPLQIVNFSNSGLC